MYDVNAAKRMILKYGIPHFISYIYGDLNGFVKAQFTEVGLLVDGKPNLSLIYSLA